MEVVWKAFPVGSRCSKVTASLLQQFYGDQQAALLLLLLLECYSSSLIFKRKPFLILDSCS